MQEHTVQYLVEAPPQQVWRSFHLRPQQSTPAPRIIEYPGGRIEILNEGDEAGQGLVRICTFEVPRYLLSGGRAMSWETITEARLDEFSRYIAIGKPLWSRAEGWHSLEEMGDGRTRLTFNETYHALNPVLRVLFERRVHRFISDRNDGGVRRHPRPARLGRARRSTGLRGLAAMDSGAGEQSRRRADRRGDSTGPTRDGQGHRRPPAVHDAGRPTPLGSGSSGRA